MRETVRHWNLVSARSRVLSVFLPFFRRSATGSWLCARETIHRKGRPRPGPRVSLLYTLSGLVRAFLYSTLSGLVRAFLLSYLISSAAWPARFSYLSDLILSLVVVPSPLFAYAYNASFAQKVNQKKKDPEAITVHRKVEAG